MPGTSCWHCFTRRTVGYSTEGVSSESSARDALGIWTIAKRLALRRNRSLERPDLGLDLRPPTRESLHRQLVESLLLGILRVLLLDGSELLFQLRNLAFNGVLLVAELRLGMQAVREFDAFFTHPMRTGRIEPRHLCLEIIDQLVALVRNL